MCTVSVLIELGSHYANRTFYVCFVLRIISGPRVKFVQWKAFKTPPVVYTTDRSETVVPMLFLFCVALWFTLRGASCLVLPSLCLCVSSVLLAFWSPCLGKRELVFVLIVPLFVSYAHVNLCHYFSSSWYQRLAATSACGCSCTFLFTFLFVFNAIFILFIYFSGRGFRRQSRWQDYSS